MQLPALIEVVLQPGNPDACTSVPSGATFQVCRDGDALCLPIAADPNACAAAPSDDGSSFPVAAVAVPVAVVACAAVVVAGYMWYRHRCKAVQPTAVYKVRPGPACWPPLPACLLALEQPWRLLCCWGWCSLGQHA